MRVILILYTVSFLGCSDEKPPDTSTNKPSTGLIVIEKHQGRLYPSVGTASGIKDNARQSTSLQSEDGKHAHVKQWSNPKMINRETIRDVILQITMDADMNPSCSEVNGECPTTQHDKDVENLVTVLLEQIKTGGIAREAISRFIQVAPEVIQKKAGHRLIDECLEVFHVIGAHDLSPAHTETLLHQLNTILDRATSTDPSPSETLIQKCKSEEWPNQEHRSIIERIGRLLDLDIDGVATNILSLTAEKTVKLVSGESPGKDSQLSEISREVTEARNDLLLEKTTSVENQRHLSSHTLAALREILQAAN